jgi:hypothetical protein
VRHGKLALAPSDVPTSGQAHVYLGPRRYGASAPATCKSRCGAQFVTQGVFKSAEGRAKARVDAVNKTIDTKTRR